MISTGAGAVLDFISHDTAWLVPAIDTVCTKPPCSEDGSSVFKLPVPKKLTWSMSTPEQLAGVMADVIANRSVSGQVPQKAHKGWMSARVLTWAHAHEMVLSRLKDLRRKRHVFQQASQFAARRGG